MRKKALNEEIEIEITTASRASDRRHGDGRARGCRVQFQPELEFRLEHRL
jgi:hypothetical protein